MTQNRTPYRMSRRGVLRGGAVLGVGSAALLAGCGGGSSSKSTTAAATPTPRAAEETTQAKKGGTLRYPGAGAPPSNLDLMTQTTGTPLSVLSASQDSKLVASTMASPKSRSQEDALKTEYRHILVDRSDGVVTVTLNEPRRLNPWLIPMMEELSVEMDRVKADPDDRVVVFTGAGTAFSSGGDVRAMAGVEYPEPHWMQYGENHQRGLWNAPTMTAEERLKLKTLSGTRFHRQVFYLDKPTIAAVNGVAAGAGADLAFTCDLRIAAQSARFIEVYIRRALVPLDGGAFWAPYHLPHAKAMEMLLTGDAMSAEEALRWGIVNKVVPDNELMETTMELAHRLAKQPPVAVQLVKHMVREIHMKDGYEQGWDLAEKAGAVTRQTRDHHEAVTAFIEKRQPNYTGS